MRSKLTFLALPFCLAVVSCGPKQNSEPASESLRPTAIPNHPKPTPSSTVRKDSGPAQSTDTTFNKYGFVRPAAVKGIYLTAWSAGSSRKMAKVAKLLDDTELNSVVIDIRDSGEMYWKTGIPLANEAVGKAYLAVPKPKKLFSLLAAHQIWPIARIACFRDNHVPLKHPDRAVQVPSGKVWKDRSGHMWLDPYNKKNWDYIAATVDFAINVGFPEIQLDYVRFPSEGRSSAQVFPAKSSYPDQKAKPEDVIASFANFIREKVKARGAYYSADIFGIISSSHQDQGIGQELEKLAGPFDCVSPMIYPSHFHKGEYGIKNPDLAPYEIISKSLQDYKRRVPKKSVRPWLQDFSLANHYGPAQVRAQIKATYDLGYKEWLLWNAGNQYSEAALLRDRPPQKVAVPPVQ